MKGKLIVFEGMDGCGKSTQVTLVRDWIKQVAPELNVVIAKEPGNPDIPFCKEVRKVIFGEAEWQQELNNLEQGLLLTADHAQNSRHVAKLVYDGAIVLQDRWGPISQRAYDPVRIQARPDIHPLMDRYSFAKPDMVILFSTAPLEVARRIAERERVSPKQGKKPWGNMENVEDFCTTVWGSYQAIAVDWNKYSFGTNNLVRVTSAPEEDANKVFQYYYLNISNLVFEGRLKPEAE